MSRLSSWLWPAQGEKRSNLTWDELGRMLSAPNTAAGKYVSDEGAFRQVTYLACVQLIAESVGMLPLILYRRLERGKERATNHPLYDLLHSLPNPELTAMELFENVAAYVACWGNAYSEIEYDNAGRRIGIWPLRPDRMSVDVTEDNERLYVYTFRNGAQVAIPRRRIWHVRGWGTDPVVGKSRVALARDTIGLAMATEEFGARFFGNNSQPGGILTTDQKLDKDKAKALKARWEEAHNGLDKAWRVAVMEEGLKWQSIGVPNQDAQFLETRKFQEIDICQLFRVPPHMIGITDKSTSWGTGIEEMGIGFVSFTLMPYLVRIAQSVGRDLLTPQERRELFAEHLTAALERGDLKTRYDAYNVGRNGGWLSVNDIREAENMNAVEQGDGYLQPLNMAPLGTDASEGNMGAQDGQQ
jgi:HK97 family phage portal protein